ncbi:MAG: hypothetical protein JWQ01_293 [Massilia sp.]|nr:hypothetical protein [Massilia sp.]
MFYAPSIAYWRFRLGQDHIALGPDVALQLKRGWYPILTTQGATRTYVVVLKINPWFPSEKSASVLTFSYKTPACQLDLAGNPALKLHQFPWGVAAIYPGYKAAYVLDGRVTVNFGDTADLTEIVSLSTVRPQPSLARCPNEATG